MKTLSCHAQDRFLPMVLLGMLVLLQACSHSGSFDTQALSGSRAYYIQAPFVEQQSHLCGPASLAVMFGHQQVPVSMEQLVQEVYLPGRNGSFPLEMQAALRDRGLLVYPVETPVALFAELDAGHPVLVLQNLGLRSIPKWHYSVVVGYEDSGETVLLHDGHSPFSKMSFSRFVRTWSRADFWGRIAVGEGDFPVMHDPVEVLNSIHQLENIHLDAATGFWQEASTRYEKDYRLLMAFANHNWSLFNSKKKPAFLCWAVQGYQSVIELNDHHVPGWNNLSYALHKAQCSDRSRKVIDSAREKFPDHPLLEKTALEIEAESATSGHEQHLCMCDGK